MNNATDLSRFQHRRFARLWERISVESDRRGTAEHRRQCVAGLSGRVIEIGAGNGRNFAHYPREVSEVVALEPEDQLRELAERAAADAPVPVRVVAAHADALPFDDDTFDAAVVSLVLCSVPDMLSSLTELQRVLKPGGRLRFFEHVRSINPLIGVFQDAVTPAWGAVGGGCHLNRDTTTAISGAGFTVTSIDRFTYRPMRFIPAHAHILGTAHT